MSIHCIDMKYKQLFVVSHRVLYTGIMVNLQQSGYIVTEGQTATVCAGVTGDRDIPVTIGVSTTPITAEG